MNKDEGKLIVYLKFLSGTAPADINVADSTFVKAWDEFCRKLEKNANVAITQIEADLAGKKVVLPITTHAVT
jgi:hypothetical protein